MVSQGPSRCYAKNASAMAMYEIRLGGLLNPCPLHPDTVAKIAPLVGRYDQARRLLVANSRRDLFRKNSSSRSIFIKPASEIPRSLSNEIRSYLPRVE